MGLLVTWLNILRVTTLKVTDYEMRFQEVMVSRTSTTAYLPPFS